MNYYGGSYNNDFVNEEEIVTAEKYEAIMEY